jgi:hypothetical protein
MPAFVLAWEKSRTFRRFVNGEGYFSSDAGIISPSRPPALALAPFAFPRFEHLPKVPDDRFFELA